MCDFGTGNNNKMNFVERNRQDVINILEAVYRGATKGKGQVNSPKGMFEVTVLVRFFFFSSSGIFLHLIGLE